MVLPKSSILENYTEWLMRASREVARLTAITHVRIPGNIRISQVERNNSPPPGFPSLNLYR